MKVRSPWIFLHLVAMAALFLAVTGPATAQNPNYHFDKIALTGEPAPGSNGRSFDFLTYEPAVNGLGEVVITADTGVAGGFSPVDGIWKWSNGTLSKSAANGDAAPGPESGTFLSFFPSGHGLNNFGDVGFFATL